MQNRFDDDLAILVEKVQDWPGRIYWQRMKVLHPSAVCVTTRQGPKAEHSKWDLCGFSGSSDSLGAILTYFGGGGGDGG
jgi:hypothetical protein